MASKKDFKDTLENNLKTHGNNYITLLRTVANE